ncbi:MAG: carbohydrate ABC transporter permease [Clostridiaceae bacterium]|nr:carbohydrate ABC transporter permease [Clostridiaceae bacterium]
MYGVSQNIKNTANIILKILVVAIFAFPFLWVISVSLQTDAEVNTFPATIIPKTPQFNNYVRAWQAGPFLTYFKNSVVIIVAIITIQMLIMIPAAYAFAMYDFKLKNILFSLVLIAFMVPTQVTFVPVYLMMGEWGLLRTLWPQILPFMTNAFGIFLLRQYFMQVPEELIEAARLDNASELKIVYKLMIPMAKPALATIILFSFVSHWNEYFWPLIMTNTTDVRPLTVGIAALKSTEGFVNWNTIMAGNMFLIAPILIVYVFCSRFIIKAFSYSGIK